MFKLIPLTEANVKYNTLISAANQILERNVTRSLDTYRMNSQSYPGFLATLAEMRKENSSPILALESAGQYLDHLFFSFLVISTSDLPCLILEQTKLSVFKVVGAGGVALSIVSGTLAVWKVAIDTVNSETMNTYVRQLLEQCYDYYVQNGLGKLWPSNNIKDEQKRLPRIT